jgi:ABC-type sugar transport system substrate-binding protein
MSVRVALFLPEPKNPYQQSMAAEAGLACARVGFELLDTSFAESSGGGGDVTAGQVRQIYAAVHAPEDRRPHAILVMPVQEAALNGLMETAVEAGIGVMFLNRACDVAALRAKSADAPVGFVTPDHRGAGHIQGRQVSTLLGGAGNVMYVRGRASNASAQERGAGFHEAIAGSRIEIATSLEGNWSGDMARACVEKWLRLMLPSGYIVHAVASQSDLMAVGILQALRTLSTELGIPAIAKVPVFGLDGVESVGKRLVDEGALAATVSMPTTAGRAIELLAEWHQGRRPFPPKVVLPASPYPAVSAVTRVAEGAAPGTSTGAGTAHP